MEHEFIVKGTPISLQTKSSRSKAEWKRMVHEAASARIAEVDRLEWVEVSVKILHYCFDWTEGDLDNIAKPILDALEGKAFFNDSQVVQLFMRRTDLKKHRHVTEIVGASSMLLDQLQESLQNEEGFVFISIAVGDADEHTRLT